MTHNDFLSHRYPNILTRIGRKLYHYALPRSKERMVVRGGVSYCLNYKEYLEKKIINHGIWERNQINYFFPKCRELNCEIFLDVGSYFGYYSLLAAKSGMFEQIHALEVSPVTYSRLEKHIRINNMAGKIHPHQLAASNAAKEVYLQSKGDGFASFAKIDDKGTLSVMAAPLDSVFDFRGKNIAIKMDIEDHEIPALQGAKTLIDNNNVFLQVEVHGDQVETIAHLMNTGWQILYHCDGDFYFYRAATSHAR